MIKKRDLDKRIEKIEESIGYEGKVYISGISIGIQEAIQLIVSQFGDELKFVKKEKK